MLGIEPKSDRSGRRTGDGARLRAVRHGGVETAERGRYGPTAPRPRCSPATLAVPDGAGRNVWIEGSPPTAARSSAGMLFAALPGTKTDGAELHAGDAVDARRGRDPAGEQSVCRATPASRSCASTIRATPWRWPPRASMPRQPRTVAAVTGTNGKTSVSVFLRQIWETAGHARREPRHDRPRRAAARRDRRQPDHARSGQAARDPGAISPATTSRIVALEASSHGLDQRRLDGVALRRRRLHQSRRATISTITRRSRTISRPSSACSTSCCRRARAAVVDADQPQADEVARASPRTRGLESSRRRPRGARRCASSPSTRMPDGARLVVEAWGETPLRVAAARRRSSRSPTRWSPPALPSRPASTAPKALGALADLKGASGRLELVGTHPSGALVFVDYAHTPDALATALQALRPHAEGKLAVVFGAGGDRDPGKRPLMGEAAAATRRPRHRHRRQSAQRERRPPIRRAIIDGAPGTPRRSATAAQAIRAAVAALQRGRRPAHRRQGPRDRPDRRRRGAALLRPGRGARRAAEHRRAAHDARSGRSQALRRRHRRHGPSAPPPAGDHRHLHRQPHDRAGRGLRRHPRRHASTGTTSSPTRWSRRGASRSSPRASAGRRPIGAAGWSSPDDPLRRWSGSASRRARACAARSSPSPAASARPAPRRCCAGALGRRRGACAGRLLQQPLGRAADARPHACRRRASAIFEIGMNHAGEIRPLAQHGPPACRDRHHRRAGAPRVFFNDEAGIAERQGRDLRGSRAGRRRHPQPRQSLVRRSWRSAPRRPGVAHRLLRRARPMPTSASTACRSGAEGSSFRPCSPASRSPTGSARRAVISSRTRSPWSPPLDAAWRRPGARSMLALAGLRARRRAAASASTLAHPRRRLRADRRELQRQSGLHARGAGASGAGGSRGRGPPHRRARRHAGTRRDRRRAPIAACRRRSTRPMPTSFSWPDSRCGASGRTCPTRAGEPMRKRRRSSNRFCSMPIGPGDVVMVKASLGTRLGPVVEAVKRRFSPDAA